MNIIQKLLTALAVMITAVPITMENTATVNAKEDTGKYPLACKAYEVDNVNASGGFTKVSCHDTFADAVSAMSRLGDDGVVRHGGSYSQTKIIAMNNGMAFAYPFRDGTSMMYYYQDAGFSSSYASTYTGQHYQMKYFETASYAGNGTGKLRVNMNGFEGYVELKDVDLVPLRFFTDELSVLLGGNETFYNTPEEPYTMVPKMNLYRCAKNGNYKDLLFTSYYGWSDDGVNAVRLNNNLPLPAADWMSEGTVYYSFNGYDFYTDMGFHNFAGQYFNYYQFLPMRTKSGIDASVFDAFLKANNISSSSKLYGAAQYFIDAQNDYGVNALIVYAMACIESGYGTSYYAQTRNNFFGWGAVDSNPGEAASYKSVEEGIRKQVSENLAGYLDMDDWRYYGSMLGNKGAGFNLKYASAAYWGMNIASAAYRIDKYSCGNNGKLTDFNTVNIGIVMDKGAYASLSKGGKKAYDITSCGGKYVPVYPVAVLAKEDDYYKTQCTNYVVDGKIYYIHSGSDVRKYDWDRSVGWFNASSVRLVNNMDIPEEKPAETGEAKESLDAFTVNGTVIALTGTAYREGVSTKDNALSAKLVLCDEAFREMEVINAETTSDAEQRTVWKAQYDLAKLKDATRCFKLVYTYEKTPEYGGEFFLTAKEVPEDFVSDRVRYSFAVSEKGYVNVSAFTIVCGANEEYDESAGACIVTVHQSEEIPADDISLMRGVQDVSFDEKTSILSLSGLAFFKNADAKQGEVKHSLALVNTETDSETFLPCETVNSDDQANGSKYDLSAIGWQAEINLGEIPGGNYYLRIHTENNDRSGEGALFTNLEGISRSIVNSSGETVRFFANPLSNYRLELSVEKQSLDLDEVNKPSRMTSLFGKQEMNIEGNSLCFEGFGILYGASMSENDAVSYRVYFENEEGEVFSADAVTRPSAVDFAKAIGSKLPLTNASFGFSFDLAKLASGNYRMYLEINTSSYYDVIEMYSITDDSLEARLADGRTCRLQTTGVRSRYVLCIAEEG